MRLNIMSKSKAELVLDRGKCAPCPELFCIDNCPWGVFQLGPDKKPQVFDAASCNVCGLCESLCPNKAIRLKRKRFNNV